MEEDAYDSFRELHTGLSAISSAMGTLRDARYQLQSEYREAVEETLSDLIEGLDEEIPFLSVEEVSRAGHYAFEEVLTPDGIVARDIRRVYGSAKADDRREEEVNTAWRHDWTVAPLDVETYLYGSLGDGRTSNFSDQQLLDIGTRILQILNGKEEPMQVKRGYD